MNRGYETQKQNLDKMFKYAIELTKIRRKLRCDETSSIFSKKLKFNFKNTQHKLNHKYKSSITISSNAKNKAHPLKRKKTKI